MADTKFPDLRQMWLDGDIDSAIGDSDDWFKRCKAEFPYADPYGDDTSDPLFLKLIRDRHIWFIKWFGQFKETKE